MKKNRPLCMELLLAGMLISLLALTPDFTLAQCPDATIRIEIFTDNYPEETTWQLFDQSTGLVIASDDLSIAGLPFTLYSWDVCVTSTGCYDFTINDAFGDGICCAEGSGYYNVYFNGALVTTGGAFFFSETTTDIGGCSSQGCPESTVALQIFTDNYPEETSWQLVDRSSGFIIAQDNLTGQPDQTLVTYEICVAANGCYTFTIFDSFGDGICCSFGNGYYNLYLDGILQATGGSFGTSDLASIGNCAPSGSCTTCQGPPPANDACIGATNLGALNRPSACAFGGLGIPQTFAGTNICATAEFPYGYIIGCQTGGDMAAPAADVWYTFSITGSELVVNLTSSLNGVSVGLWQDAGAGCTGLVARACAETSSGGNLADTFVALAPGTYFLQISGMDTLDQCDFTLTLTNNHDCEACIQQNNLTASPPPVNGRYQAGTTVTFTYVVEDYNQTSINWIHGIVPHFGPGWDLSTLTNQIPPASCDINGYWAWYDRVITGTFRPISDGPGFFFESTLGCPTICDPNNPGDNYGDQGVSTSCQLIFQWTISTVASCPPGQTGDDLSIEIFNYGDSETGSWTQAACENDPNYLFFARLFCCDSSIITVQNVSCSGGSDGSITVQGQGIAPFDYELLDLQGNLLQAQSDDSTEHSFTGLPAGTYQVRTTDENLCTDLQQVQILQGDQLNISAVVSNVSCNGGSDGAIDVAISGGTAPFTYLWNDFAATEDRSVLPAGNYSITVFDDSQCSGTASFTVSEPAPIPNTVVQVQICDGDSYFAGGANQTQSGTYFDTLLTTAGCDSVIETQLTVFPNSFTAISVSVCEGDGIFAEGAFQTEPGIYYDTLEAANGCDSILETTLIVNPEYFVQVAASICEGDSFLAGGAFQTTSGIYYDSLLTSSGCDSIIETNLTVNDVLSATIPVSICEGDSFFTGGAFQNQSGTYFDTLTTPQGCDSVIITELTVISSINTSVDASVCRGDEYNGIIINNDTTLVEVFTSSAGCDSIVTTNISATPISTENISVSICAGESYFAGGADQTEPGFYFDTFVASTGCDSILITELTVLPLSAGNVQVSICLGDSFFTGGAFQTEKGTYHDTLTGSNGCDSILITELDVIPPSFGNMQASICQGDSFFAGGAFQTQPGFYTDTLLGAASTGCDSILTTELIVIPPSHGNTQVSICEGDSYFAGGASQTEPGFYVDTLLGAASTGCDSILTTELIVIPPSFGNTTVTICDGDTYNVGGGNQTQPGFYTDTLAGSNGCDSILTTELIVLPNTSFTQHINICSGQSFFAGGAQQTMSGTYYDTLVAANGCDSVLITNLTVGSPLRINFDVNEVSCDCTVPGNGGGTETCTLDFAGLPHGAIIPNYFSQLGVTVTADAGSTFPDQLIVFNSNLTGTPDPDLQAGIGNLAIFPHNLNDSNNDGLVDSPDDQGSGGTITFTFDDPRTVFGFTFVDNDRNGGTVRAYDANNNLITTVNVPASTPGSIQNVTLNIAEVTRLTITYADSRGVGSISFSCPPQSCGVDLSGFAHGEIVTGQEIAPGITVTGTSNTPAQFPNAVAIFNSNVTNSLDPDLEAGIGNILILPEYLTDNNGDGIIDNPSDAGNGGKMTFTFDRDRTVFKITLIDNDRNNGTIKAYDANSNLLLSVTTPSGAEGSVQTYNLNVSGVRRLEINYWDSRGVAGLLLDCPLVNCCDGNATASASGGFPPYQFSWSTGSTSAYSGDSLCEGTYTVTVTDALGCTASDDVSLVRANVTEQTAQICEGESILLGGALQTVPGFYYDTLGVTDGCFEILKTELSVLPNRSATIQVQICQGQSYFAGGAFQTTSGTYNDTLVAANGCDSILTTELSVLPALLTLIDAQICEGQSYFAGGADQTTSGTYTDTFTSSGGCDSIVVTHLTVLPLPLTSVSAQICAGDSLFVGGDFQTEAGTYIDTFTAFNGCDSVVATTLSVLPALVENVSAEICEGESYFAGGDFQTEAGIYTDTFTSSSGCDSIVVTELIVNPVYQLTQQVQICPGDSFFAGGAFQTEAGTYIDSFLSSEDCDSILVTELSIQQTIVETRQATICEGDSFFAGGAFQTEPGTYIDSFISSGGCDSILLTELSVQQPTVTNVSHTICEGDSLFVGGSFQTEAGTYTDTLVSAAGCDSIVITQLTVASLSLNGTVADVGCFGGTDGTIDLTVSGGTPPYTYQWSNNIPDEDISGLSFGPYSVTVTDALGCTASAGFFVNQPQPLALGAVTVPVTCNGGNDGAIDLVVQGGTSPYTYAWSTGDTTEDISGLTAGFYTVVVTDANGCQATVIVQVLEPAPIPNTNVQAQICEGESYFAGGTDQTQAGTYYDTLRSTTGCDSIVITELSVLPSSSFSLQVVICEGQSYFAGGDSQTVSGIYYDTLVAANDCDSIIITALTVFPAPVTNLQTQICEGDSFFAGGAFQTQSGIYFDTLLTPVGCDSIVITELTVLPPSVTTIQAEICEGDSYFAGGTDQSQSGTYYDTLTGANGCDSIIVTELTVNPNKLTGIEAVICEGDSIFAGGAYQTEPGAYFDTLQTSEGCDSIIETDVVMLPSSLENVQASICEGDSFFAGGAFQTQSGTYFDTLANSSGCDSIIITEIIVIPPAISFVSAQICSGDSFFVGGGYQTISGEYVDTLTSAAGCDSIVITDLFVCSLDLQAQSLNVSCFGGNDGSISLSVGGGCSLPYSFSWSNNSSGSSIDSLSAGQYDVTVTESGLGCSATASFEITEPTQILLSGQKTDVTCFGASDGTIDLTVTGGTPEYSYQWSNGSITEDISGLSPGPYSATVTDAAGCTASEGFFVTQPGPLALGGVPTPASCNGASDGAIDLNVLGGIPPYSYSWSTSDTTEDISGLTGGFYTVQVTDLNGCQANVIVQVLEPDALSIEDSTTHESAQGANDGAIDITVSGGTSPYDYRWSTGDTTEDLSGLPAGTYIVTVTDDNGCEISDTIEVEVLPPGQPKPDRFDVSVYPNPFNDHLFVDITSKEADVGYIIITDVLGRKLFTLLIDIQQGENKYQLRMGGILSSGTYVMEVVTGKGNEKVKKVVRE